MTKLQEIIMRDSSVNRPATAPVGSLFYNTSDDRMERWSGSAWEVVEPTGAAPSGAAGGDLSGTYPDPSVKDDSHNHTQATLTNFDTTINVIIDGGGAAITSGIKGDFVVDFKCQIIGYGLLADQAGDIVLDLWKDTYANFPPDVSDTITASAKPTLSTEDKSQDSTLTGWDTAIDAGDIIRVNVDSVATVERVSLALKVRRIP